MPASSKKQKLYCYVDESGQDTASSTFVVVAVVSSQDQEKLRQALLQVEQEARTDGFKWHKSQWSRRLHYLNLVLERGLGQGEVFFGSYPKPLPYFFPLLDVVERAIKVRAGHSSYTARVFVDGIDRLKAGELTNALRLRGVSLEMVRGRRDESEPLIRLADMWAGCVRAALLKSIEAQALLRRALKANYIGRIKENTP